MAFYFIFQSLGFSEYQAKRRRNFAKRECSSTNWMEALRAARERRKMSPASHNKYAEAVTALDNEMGQSARQKYRRLSRLEQV